MTFKSKPSTKQTSISTKGFMGNSTSTTTTSSLNWPQKLFLTTPQDLSNATGAEIFSTYKIHLYYS